MICGCEKYNGTDECHLAVFSVDVAFACHFVAPHHHSKSACAVGYASTKLSKMASNSATYSFNRWCIGRQWIAVELWWIACNASICFLPKIQYVLQIIKIDISKYL